MITAREVAKQKGCTKAAVTEAIRRGLIDAKRFGNLWAIIQNSKLDDWQPMKVRQQAGRARWSTSKAKKARRSA